MQGLHHLFVVAITTIPLDPSTREQLKALGPKGETYDGVVRPLLAASEDADFVEEQDELLSHEKHWVRPRDPS